MSDETAQDEAVEAEPVKATVPEGEDPNEFVLMRNEEIGGEQRVTRQAFYDVWIDKGWKLVDESAENAPPELSDDAKAAIEADRQAEEAMRAEREQKAADAQARQEEAAGNPDSPSDEQTADAPDSRRGRGSSK